MSMLIRQMVLSHNDSVYLCSDCGARQIVLHGERPPEKCIECGPEAERIDKVLSRVLHEEDQKRIDAARAEDAKTIGALRKKVRRMEEAMKALEGYVVEETP